MYNQLFIFEHLFIHLLDLLVPELGVKVVSWSLSLQSLGENTYFYTY